MPPRTDVLSSIVFVDDNAFDNEFHTTILRKAGFECPILAFETGEEAMRHLTGPELQPNSILFLDVNLPGESGFDIAESIGERLPASANLIACMLSSSPDPRDVEKARSIPIVREFLVKPLKVATVVELVARHLGA